MIKSFKHKGLQALFEKGRQAGIDPKHADKLGNILARLNVATRAEELNFPGFGIHPLRGDRAGEWAIVVRANWRVTFEFDGQNVIRVDYEDYH